jgi:hypothetical protein
VRISRAWIIRERGHGKIQMPTFLTWIEGGTRHSRRRGVTSAAPAQIEAS